MVEKCALSLLTATEKARIEQAAGPDLDASTLRILELLETCPIEEVARITGYDIRSLRVLWSRYRKTHLPRRTRKEKHGVFRCL